MNGREGDRVKEVTRKFNVRDKEGPMTLFAGCVWYGTKGIYRIWFRLDVELRHVEGKTQVFQTKINGHIGQIHSHNLNCMVIKWIWVSWVF